MQIGSPSTPGLRVQPPERHEGLSEGRPCIPDMTTDRAHGLVDAVCGEPDAAAVRAVAVLQAHGAVLAWVRQATGSYPAPVRVAERLQEAALRLRTGVDAGEPGAVLVQIAAAALAEDRSRAA
jgi:hypothetical protein